MPALTPAIIAAAVDPFALGPLSEPPSWRWWRWFAELPDERVAFIAEDDEAWARLRREEALLTHLAAHVAFKVPEVTVTCAVRRVQVRRKVPGMSGFAVEDLAFGVADRALTADRYRADFPISGAGRRLAGDLGRALAQLQRAAPADAARALGFPDTSYTAVLDAVAQRLAEHPDLGDLGEALPPLRRWFAALPCDPVLAHRDIQAHNMAVAPESGALLGIFDFDDAAVAHRLEDFKYLPSFGPTFTAVAVDAYGQAGGSPPAVEDIARFHLFAAFEHFLFVAEDGSRWAHIVDWTRSAMAWLASCP